MFSIIIVLKRGLQLLLLLALIVLLLITALTLFTYFAIETIPAEVAAPETTTYVSFTEEKIAIRTWPGTSTTSIVLVGGLSAWSGTWEHTINEQRDRGNNDTFVTIDLPPFGYSVPGSAPDYSRITQAQRINTVIDSLKTKNIILVGHSYGGGPITEAALQQPQRVTKLILISPVLNLGATAKMTPTGIVTNNFIRTTAVATLTRIKPILLQRLDSFVYIKDNISYQLLDLYTKPFAVENTSRKLSDWLYAYLADNVAEARSSQIDSYKNLPFPIILLWGEEDTLTPINESTPLVAIKALLLPLSDTGHIPMIEDTEKFNDAFAAVLKN